MTIALRAGALALACLMLTVGAADAAGPAPTFLDDVCVGGPASAFDPDRESPADPRHVVDDRNRPATEGRQGQRPRSEPGRTIDTTLKSILATKIATGQGAQALAGVPGGVVADAIPIIRRDNPAGVAAHARTDEQLRTKIIAKLPDAQGVVAEAAAKVAHVVRS